ncbi:MAG: response regulator transcription factor [Sphingomonas sp.]|nr:response regulator transcription factor [Sphingomonas sp.]
MIRLLVADDHPIILSGLEAIFRDTDYEIVATAPDGGVVLALIESARPDILILDERMPPPGGVELLRQLRAAGDARPVVLLTADLGDGKLLEAVELGVEGIVLKESAQSRMIACLDEVSRGGRWLEPSLVQQALDLKLRETASAHRGFAALSRREAAIVDLVAQGLRNREIAAQLGLTEGTVKVYLHRIYEKLEVTNRTELAIRVRGADAARR